MRLVKYFLDINRSFSRWLLAQFPSLATGGNYKGELLGILETFISEKANCRVLEAGGIDRSLLKKSSYIEYDGLDIEERDRCKDIYNNFYVQSIEEKLPQEYDLICSFTLLEHVPDNRKALKAMYDSLSAGGVMAHYVPGGLHPYSIIIRLLGPKLSMRLLNKFHPEVIGLSGYAAYFDKCTVKQMTLLCRELGFNDIRVSCYYRANYYFEVFFPAFFLVTLWENICRCFGWESFCSGFVIRASKNGGLDFNTNGQRIK